MKYERFTWKTEKLQHSDDEVIMVVDNANKDWKGHILNIIDMLNEQEDIINELKETNNAMYKRLKEQSDIIYQLTQKLKKHMTEKELKELIENWGL